MSLFIIFFQALCIFFILISMLPFIFIVSKLSLTIFLRLHYLIAFNRNGSLRLEWIIYLQLSQAFINLSGICWWISNFTGFLRMIDLIIGIILLRWNRRLNIRRLDNIFLILFFFNIHLFHIVNRLIIKWFTDFTLI